jgi:hypothetical protein
LKIPLAKARTSLEVDFDALPPAAQEYVIRYGLTQVLNDAHSTVNAASHPDPEARAEAALAAAREKLEALHRGQTRKPRSDRKRPEVQLSPEELGELLEPGPSTQVSDWDLDEVPVLESEDIQDEEVPEFLRKSWRRDG